MKKTGLKPGKLNTKAQLAANYSLGSKCDILKRKIWVWYHRGGHPGVPKPGSCAVLLRLCDSKNRASHVVSSPWVYGYLLSFSVLDLRLF